MEILQCIRKTKNLIKKISEHYFINTIHFDNFSLIKGTKIDKKK
jgi:hypothetical protein